jgi:hypothetical protein
MRRHRNPSRPRPVPTGAVPDRTEYRTMPGRWIATDAGCMKASKNVGGRPGSMVEAVARIGPVVFRSALRAGSRLSAAAAVPRPAGEPGALRAHPSGVSRCRNAGPCQRRMWRRRGRAAQPPHGAVELRAMVYTGAEGRAACRRVGLTRGEGWVAPGDVRARGSAVRDGADRGGRRRAVGPEDRHRCSAMPDR